MIIFETTSDLCHRPSGTIICFLKQVREMGGVWRLICIIVNCLVIFHHLVITTQRVGEIMDRVKAFAAGRKQE